MILTFGTSLRHNELVSSFLARLLPLIESKKVRAYQEQCMLVFFGEKFDIQHARLVDAKEINAEQIDKLSYIQPDFFVFKENNYSISNTGMKIAGVPDLIVEVWSVSNTKEERDFKFNLYSKSDIEHWYLTQDSNVLECWFGNTKLPSQSLTKVLKTTTGLEFDLRYLALK